MIINGNYPAMITNYLPDGSIDYNSVEKLTEWYWEKGCAGVFATCQSSEIFYLSLKERITLAEKVVNKVKELNAREVRGYFSVVASAHVSDGFEAQVEELTAISELKPDAVVFITNRLDISKRGEDYWCEDLDRLIAALPKEIPLGLYEAPMPYKRLLTDKMLRHCVGTGRFEFVKDTCCDAAVIKRRLGIIKGSKVKLFNANAQTLLTSMKDGAHGYCGIMSNFHPEIINYICEHPLDPKADEVEDFFCLAAFTEALHYPVIAKYNLIKYNNIGKSLYSRSCRINELPDYDKDVIDRMAAFAKRLCVQYGI